MDLKKLVKLWVIINGTACPVWGALLGAVIGHLTSNGWGVIIGLVQLAFSIPVTVCMVQALYEWDNDNISHKTGNKGWLGNWYHKEIGKIEAPKMMESGGWRD